MSNKKCGCSSDPASKDYAEKIKNKSNEKSPFCDDEPSPRTHYK